MNPVSPISRELAQALIVLEASRKKKPGVRRGADVPAISQAESVARVCEKLRVVLTGFAGTAGFRTLLLRALTLARAQEQSLTVLQVLEDGSLSGFENLRGKSNLAATESIGLGGQLLVAQLLDLLVIFIGQPLMQQLVRSAWPDVPPGAFHSETKDTQ